MNIPEDRVFTWPEPLFFLQRSSSRKWFVVRMAIYGTAIVTTAICANVTGFVRDWFELCCLIGFVVFFFFMAMDVTNAQRNISISKNGINWNLPFFGVGLLPPSGLNGIRILARHEEGNRFRHPIIEVDPKFSKKRIFGIPKTVDLNLIVALLSEFDYPLEFNDGKPQKEP